MGMQPNMGMQPQMGMGMGMQQPMGMGMGMQQPMGMGMGMGAPMGAPMQMGMGMAPGGCALLMPGHRVHLRHHLSGHTLRSNADHTVSANGAEGRWATWVVDHVPGQPHHIRLQNVETGKFLRINEHFVPDCRGDGGYWTHLAVQPASVMSANGQPLYCFQSAHHTSQGHPCHIGAEANAQMVQDSRTVATGPRAAWAVQPAM